MTIFRALAAALVVLVVLVAGSGRADEASEKAAVAAADAWLALLDAGQFGASWDEAAERFRDAVPRAQWDRSLRRLRSPLGKLVSRKVLSTTYTETMPGAPDGKYVVVQYTSSFANKKATVETVTPFLDGDGSWRVSGYYVR